ncbi:MAG: adenine deaminase [Chitinophagaceae bacterium]|jgi:adenine deaminase|nr:adenine deaminase [Chitinophagaceae bacterium]
MKSTVSGNLVDLPSRTIFPAHISFENGIITAIDKTGDAPLPGQPYITPGFVDAHVHIESSMLIPSEFARLAVVHGTVATVSDPHEIANVNGLEGVEYMIENGKQVPFKFSFGAPSCVPATVFETAGATLDAAAVTALLQRPEVRYLSEMMNFPGVLHKDPEVMQKIAAAHAAGKPVDGHAPGLRGDAAQQYIDAGISTDHECFTAEEALDKLQRGMKILIREGSAARNFEALIGLLPEWYEQLMFCSDDKHPDSLVLGHINQLCARAVAKGMDVFQVLQVACVNPVLHYKLPVGLLRIGDPADFLLLENLTEFKVQETWIDGQKVAAHGRSMLASVPWHSINQFDCQPIRVEDLSYPVNKWGDEENFEQVYVIEALDGQLITNKLVKPITDLVVKEGALHASVPNDILKLVVVNRYNAAPIAKSFIRNFGLKKGALASSVAHDSHNIVAVGVDDESLCRAINLVIDATGGIAATDGWTDQAMALPVAGLMTNQDGYQVAARYEQIDRFTKEVLGSTLGSPFMTLSFMALLVIPHLKLSDKGLFDGDSFSFV